MGDNYLDPPPDEMPISSFPEAVIVGKVHAGERWRFTAEGTWEDWFVRCDANGYRVALFGFLDIRPEHGRFPWFALVGTVLGPIESEIFLIGKGVEHDFKTTGVLTVSANDLRSMRCNNKGEVTLRSKYLGKDLPTAFPADNSPTRSRYLQVWLDLNKAVQRTPGLLYIGALLLVFGAALVFLKPAQDVILAVIESSGDQPAHLFNWFTLLGISVFLLAFQAWFWSRSIVDFHFGDRRGWDRNLYLKWMPRLFAMIPFAALIASLKAAHRPLGYPGTLFVVMATMLMIFLIARIPTVRLLERVASKRGSGSILAKFITLILVHLKTTLLVATLFALVAALVIVLTWPVGPAHLLGPAAVVFLSISLFLPATVLLIQIGYHLRLPTLALLVAIATLVSVAGDNHGIRVLGSARPRPTLEAAYKNWCAQFPSTPGRPLTIVFVAAPGGASRAGYWTALALGKLEEGSGGRFSKNVFAISSISGSTVGSLGFLASLVDKPTLTPNGQLLQSMTDLAGRDFLSPSLAGMFFPDLLYRVLPLPGLPDRAQYLEEGFEAGWRDHCTSAPNRCADPELFTSGFLTLWDKADKEKRWLPILAIGGTREEDGRRILTSNIDLTRSVDADDFFSIVPSDIRMSTAIDNGARFPYVSPSGSMPTAGEHGGHIVDGGYFDSAGIEAARELAASVVRLSDPKDELRVLFVILSNYPIGCGPGAIKPSNIASDAVGPFVGLYGTGDAHGSHLRTLLTWSQNQSFCLPEGTPVNATVYDIKPCSPTGPLDWVLSNTARNALKKDFEPGACKEDNAEKIKAIISQLNP